MTAGILLHRTKLPLITWFWPAHLIATPSNGISVLQRANQIGVKEDTAWLPRHKFRAVMTRRERRRALCHAAMPPLLVASAA